MAHVANIALLDSALAKIDQARAWPEKLLQGLRELVVSASDEQLFQINPMRYAKERGIAGELGVELFLHATRAGLMQIQWSLLCRGCGELVANHGHLKQLDHHFFCSSCATTCPATLDEHVEVSFTVDPAVRSVRFHRPDSLSLEDYFFKFRFSRNILIRGSGVDLISYLRQQQLVLSWLAEGETRTFDFEVAEGWIVGSPRTMITTTGEVTKDVREVELVYRDSAFHPRPEIRPGPVRLKLVNHTTAAVRVLLYFTPIVTYFEYLPHLSGSRLLNDTAFRRCLKTEVVKPGTGIPVKDNVLLFTDLMGSTAMYDRVGDIAAFERVSEHFEALARIVTQCNGVVVKTMGDAIMASFNRPADAVRAALLIVKHGNELHADSEESLRPRVGIHRGPCIVVNQNDILDYFGQTVNIAARVEGVAEGNQLCVTEAVFSDDDVQSLLSGYSVAQPELKRLKGVGEPTPVYRVDVLDRG